MITVWAALESMAARLITEQATDEEIASLRALFATMEDDTAQANIDEYSGMNIRFHQAIIRLSKSQLMEINDGNTVHPYARDPGADYR